MRVVFNKAKEPGVLKTSVPTAPSTRGFVSEDFSPAKPTDKTPKDHLRIVVIVVRLPNSPPRSDNSLTRQVVLNDSPP